MPVMWLSAAFHLSGGYSASVPFFQWSDMSAAEGL